MQLGIIVIERIVISSTANSYHFKTEKERYLKIKDHLLQNKISHYIQQYTPQQIEISENSISFSSSNIL